MRSVVDFALGALGIAALVAATGCAFLTFATNEYRPILALGIASGLLALICFGLLNRRGEREV
jgi:hypothetical protein